MSCTLSDIAKKAGFSVSTVSRVLHDDTGKYKISEETKKVIRASAEQLGYTPNKLARGLRLQKTHQIGVIVPDVSNPFFATMVKSVSKAARKAGYSIIVSDADEDSTVEEESLKALLENRVDGLLIAAVGQQYAHIRALCRSRTPLVLLDRWADDLDADAISVDNVKGAYLATQHLLREGHRKIAFVQGLHGTNANEGRLQGFLQAMKDADVPPQEQYIVGDDFRSMNGYLETKLLLKMTSPPSAIFTAGDLIALGALEACRENGYHIPNDISLVTFDDPVFTTYLSPALTAVEQPISKIAELAVAMLCRRMRNPESERRKVLLEPTLHVRSSVARISPLTTMVSFTEIEKHN